MMTDYFSFFNIEEDIFIDEAALKKQFYANSKKYHPDFYSLASEAEQAEILKLSSFNNEAYKTLKDLDKRIHYILVKNNILEEEGNNKVPQDFLLEIMDINEKIMELSMDPDEALKTEVLKEVTSFKDELEQELERIDKMDEKQARFDALKDYYLKTKYLLRIQENIKGL